MHTLLARVDWDQFLYLFPDVSGYSILIPLFIAIYRIKTLNKELKIILVFLFIAALFELITNHLGSIGVNTASLFPFYILIEFFFLGVIYRMILVSDLWRRTIIYAGIVFIVLFGLNLFFFRESDNMSSYLRSLESILVIIFTLAYFYQAIDRLLTPVLNKEPMFWLSVGLLVYFSGNLIFFIVSNYLLEQSQQLLVQAYLIHSILIIIRNILFTIGLWMKPQPA